MAAAPRRRILKQLDLAAAAAADRRRYGCTAVRTEPILQSFTIVYLFEDVVPDSSSRILLLTYIGNGMASMEPCPVPLVPLQLPGAVMQPPPIPRRHCE